MNKVRSKEFYLGYLLEGIWDELDSSLMKSPIEGIALDSREVNKGYLFFAVEGKNQNGNDFIDEAFERGATAVLSDKKHDNHKVIFVPELKKLIGKISSRFFGEPSKNLETFVVTGTNGKTTCVEAISQIGNLIGMKSGYVSTIGVSLDAANIFKEANLTTPNPVDLQTILFDMNVKKTRLVSIEASSIGLDQSRLHGVEVDVAILTSFSQDHLDYHKSMKDYARAKMKLLTDLDPRIVILNANNLFDTELGGELKSWCKVTDAKVITVGERNSLNENKIANTINAYYELSLTKEGNIQVGLLCDDGFPESHQKERNFILKTVSKSLASNVVCAVVAMLAKGLNLSHVYPSLQKIKFPDGRMKVINLSSKDKCYIDYAHTPEALDTVLRDLKEAYPKSNIWCLFGCGGDRDEAKRPLMGRVAETIADNVVITNDNPRNENEMDIINQIIFHIKDKSHLKIIPNRENAINFCLNKITKSERSCVLLIAGKGHEKFQEIRGKKRVFNDRDIVDSFVNLP